MTYWNEKKDTHVPIWNRERYTSYWDLRHEINADGYRGDPLQKSEAVFLGACDVMTNIRDQRQRWPNIVHQARHTNQPLIALGTVGSGLPSMVRRLYAFIQTFGAPKIVYMSIPRFDGYEHVTRDGQCYNVSTRTLTAKYSTETGLVTPEDGALWTEQLEFNKRFRHLEEIRYMVEERFAFVETLCKAHDMKLVWTFNPSDAGIVVLHECIDVFKDISSFMRESCAGLIKVVDHRFDRSIGIETQAILAQRFLNPQPWNFEELVNTARINYEWLKQQYGDELIKS